MIFTMRALSPAAIIALATASSRPDVAKDCKAFCDEHSDGACTRNGGHFNCRTEKPVDICQHLYWTDASKTRICIDVGDGRCGYGTMNIPVQCDLIAPTISPATVSTTERPDPCSTSTEAPEPCSTSTEAPEPCSTSTEAPEPCSTSTEAPEPCSTTEAPTPCPTTEAPTPQPTDKPEPVLDECVFEGRTFECRQDPIAPICRDLYWTDSTYQHICVDIGDGKCGYGDAKTTVRCKRKIPEEPYEPRNSCERFCNEHGDNRCTKEYIRIECRANRNVCRGLYTDANKTSICLDRLDPGCGLPAVSKFVHPVEGG
ncbi:hypothetical protein FOL47_002109 [Perkinsus chesapeaki]|uniref:Uncharacterized protein n=1 Tax=Perkinsus chesapeaki TaxID=330153 RepID=A0A7J6MFC7_PERCH|nr:hypothetical protein FOL47_002109 [Perkinsus chesapeaki]